MDPCAITIRTTTISLIEKLQNKSDELSLTNTTVFLTNIIIKTRKTSEILSIEIIGKRVQRQIR